MNIAKGVLYGVLICGLAGLVGCGEKQDATQDPRTFSDPRIAEISKRFDVEYKQPELPQENLAKVDLNNQSFKYKNGTVYQPDDKYGIYSMVGYQVDKEKELYDWQKDDIVAMMILDGGNGKPSRAIERLEEAKKRTTDKELLQVIDELQKQLKDVPENVILGYQSKEEQEKYPALQKYAELERAFRKEYYEQATKQ